ncbi:adenylate/guanylate cyclase domain-containing protein [Rhizobiales bacterium]|uniref:adenylate/guanylate cyclase domain-containing protein n=1 Tax=Hongsoonwoonella zoysiae TaxID=2821844 RepID=UPI0015615605|nr:adenylate/guanylate cyclase domain-containing protein [Hongsoonwoonella zoysiae]NRG18264.1 adenylate/guanylate cyclase domain-containing protein [Hongsoonwoonella zoysiae]
MTKGRKLAAILAADVAGFSRLAGTDEELTLARLRALRSDLIDPTIAVHHGRIVKRTGDGALVEFRSVVDAIRCAIEVQTAMVERNAGLPPERRIDFRIGIHIGDVVEESDGDLMGDGVNIAARLEGMATPGAICLSEDAYRQVRSRLDLAITDLGETKLKNISEPMRIYALQVGAAGVSRFAAGGETSLSDKPSIAVLPFDNMSGDPEQDFFADGMAEDLITEFSRMPWFFVIARNSSFTYKGRAVDMKQAGRDLGAAYVLEGSVRKSGNRLRITAQLIDSATGSHVWADRYDREIADIFDIQDEITRAITAAVTPEFVSAEVRKTRRKDPSQLSAWECAMRGRAHVWKMSREDGVEARRLFQQAMELAPGSGLGVADLALVHLYEAFYGWSENRAESFKAMLATAQSAVEIDEHDPMALTILAVAQLFSREFDAALETIERALAISPYFAAAVGVRGSVFACADEPDLAIAAVKQAVRLSPHDGFLPFWYMTLWWAYHALQDYEEAAALARRACRVAPGNPSLRRQFAVSLHMLGDDEAAHNALAEYLKLMPKATVDDARHIPSKNREHLERFLAALRALGLPNGEG